MLCKMVLIQEEPTRSQHKCAHALYGISALILNLLAEWLNSHPSQMKFLCLMMATFMSVRPLNIWVWTRSLVCGHSRKIGHIGSNEEWYSIGNERGRGIGKWCNRTKRRKKQKTMYVVSFRCLSQWAHQKIHCKHSISFQIYVSTECFFSTPNFLILTYYWSEIRDIFLWL